MILAHDVGAPSEIVRFEFFGVGLSATTTEESIAFTSGLITEIQIVDFYGLRGSVTGLNLSAPAFSVVVNDDFMRYDPDALEKFFLDIPWTVNEDLSSDNNYFTSGSGSNGRSVLELTRSNLFNMGPGFNNYIEVGPGDDTIYSGGYVLGHGVTTSLMPAAQLSPPIFWAGRATTRSMGALVSTTLSEERAMTRSLGATI
ncbi:MAG: hypothetical protein ACK4HW_05010 [Roseinatronobacter sp.]